MPRNDLGGIDTVPRARRTADRGGAWRDFAAGAGLDADVLAEEAADLIANSGQPEPLDAPTGERLVTARVREADLPFLREAGFTA